MSLQFTSILLWYHPFSTDIKRIERYEIERQIQERERERERGGWKRAREDEKDENGDVNKKIEREHLCNQIETQNNLYSWLWHIKRLHMQTSSL